MRRTSQIDERTASDACVRSSHTGRGWLAIVFAAFLLLPIQAQAQALDKRDVLVVFNGTSPVSRSAAYYYAFSRGIALDMLVELQVPLVDPLLGNPIDEVIDRARYGALIRDPVVAATIAVQSQKPVREHAAAEVGADLLLDEDGYWCAL